MISLSSSSNSAPISSLKTAHRLLNRWVPSVLCAIALSSASPVAFSLNLKSTSTDESGSVIQINPQLAIKKTGGRGGPDGFAPNPETINLNQMEQNIINDMDGNAVGYAYAITKNGVLMKSGADGDAKIAIDGWSPMTATSRLQLASVTKPITAVATLKLLEANNLSVDDLISDWLPSDWVKGAGVHQLTFRHLLTHRSGFNQLIQQLSKADKAMVGNDWDGVQFVVSNGAIPNASSSYKNVNYALLRVIIPELWKAAGAPFNIGMVTKWNHGMWYLSYIQHNLFIPMGVNSVACWEQPAYDGAYAYQLGNPGKAGTPFNGTIQNCGGHAGLHLSAIDLANFMAHIGHDDSLFSPANRLLMNSGRLGWNQASNTNSNNRLGKYWHGGDYYSNGREIHNCVMKFPQNVEATLVINSNQTSGKNQCTILKNAFDNAL
ncbi:MAG: beta-lactamase family protein [Gammaproteobacteria bacterium]|nr:beta-lactamase family protein [Gammaproteobacteria bacterium]